VNAEAAFGLFRFVLFGLFCIGSVWFVFVLLWGFFSYVLSWTIRIDHQERLRQLGVTASEYSKFASHSDRDDSGLIREDEHDRVEEVWHGASALAFCFLFHFYFIFIFWFS
jgi:hypothetical protein